MNNAGEKDACYLWIKCNVSDVEKVTKV